MKIAFFVSSISCGSLESRTRLPLRVFALLMAETRMSVTANNGVKDLPNLIDDRLILNNHFCRNLIKNIVISIPKHAFNQF